MLGRGVSLPFKSTTCFLQPCASPGCKPCWLSESDILGTSVSPMQVPRVGVTDVEHKPLAPQERSLVLFVFGSLLIVDGYARGGGFSECVSLHLLPISMWPFWPLLYIN